MYTRQGKLLATQQDKKLLFRMQNLKWLERWREELISTGQKSYLQIWTWKTYSKIPEKSYTNDNSFFIYSEQCQLIVISNIKS